MSTDTPIDWRALHEDAPCGLLLTDRNGLIVHANRTFCRWLGLSPDVLAGRKRLQDLLTMGGRIFHQTHWAPLLRLQGSVGEVKLDFLHADGHAVPMVMNAVARGEGQEGGHEIALFVAHDRHAFEKELISARKRAEEALAQQGQAQAALVRAAEDRALFAEQMMGIVSHDLRNPLAAISTACHVLELSQLPSVPARAVEFIRRSTRRAETLVADLLDFTLARVGTGLSLRPESIDLHGLVARGVEELAQAHPASVLIHRGEAQGACIADGKRLFQMLGNLVSNATAYGTPGEPVTVTSKLHAGGWSIAVHNWGPPIPEAQRPALFEPMVRGEAQAHAGTSVGLGLYIVREIAHAHGGEVFVASDVEQGTVFEVRVAPKLTD